MTPQQSAKAKKLVEKRVNAVRALQSHDRKVKSMKDDSPRNDIMIRLQAIEQAYEKLKLTSEELENCEDFTFDDVEETDVDMFELYFNMATKLKNWIKDDSMPLSSTLKQKSNPIVQEVKLPRIEIPKFNGEYEEWTSFYDAFSSLIDNSNLSDVSKMHQLRDCLTGTAFSLIKNLPVTEANFKIAWELLQKRFHNKRAIVNACLSKLLSQEKIKKATANNLRTFIDTTHEAITSIEILDVPIDDWDPIVVFLMESRFDDETKKQWEIHLKGSKEIPKFNDMCMFLETQFNILNASEHTNIDYGEKRQTKIAAVKMQDYSVKCEICQENHFIFFCPVFDSWNVNERKKWVKDSNRCFRCLNKHILGQCRTRFTCKQCNSSKHNTKLHDPSWKKPESQSNSNSNDNANSSLNIALMKTGNKVVATAIVKVKDKFGMKHLLRAFIDPGSEGATISESAAQLLCLPRQKENIPMTGLDDVLLGNATSSVKIQVEPAIDNEFKMTIEALVVRSILTTAQHKKSNWNQINGLNLADPDFLNAKKCDLLFGVDIFALILKKGLRKGESHEPIAIQSLVGLF